MSDIEINKFIVALEKVGNTIFSCHFIKKSNGEYRKMVARFGVKKNLKGKGLSYNPSEKRLLSVYDMQKEGYRMIPYDNIVVLKAKGNTFIDMDKLNTLGNTIKNEVLERL